VIQVEQNGRTPCKRWAITLFSVAWRSDETSFSLTEEVLESDEKNLRPQINGLIFHVEPKGSMPACWFLDASPRRGWEHATSKNLGCTLPPIVLGAQSKGAFLLGLGRGSISPKDCLGMEEVGPAAGDSRTHSYHGVDARGDFFPIRWHGLMRSDGRGGTPTYTVYLVISVRVSARPTPKISSLVPVFALGRETTTSAPGGWGLGGS